MEFKQPQGNKVQAEITQNGQYNNFYPTGSDKHGVVGLRPGDYVVAIKRQYADPMENEGKYGKYWLGSFEIDGTEVSMFINKENQAKEFAAVAGLDEPFKIYWEFEDYEYNGEQKKRKRLRFAPGAE